MPSADLLERLRCRSSHQVRLEAQECLHLHQQLSSKQPSTQIQRLPLRDKGGDHLLRCIDKDLLIV